MKAAQQCSNLGYYTHTIVDCGNWNFKASCSDEIPNDWSKPFSDESAREAGFENRNKAAEADCKKKGYATIDSNQFRDRGNWFFSLKCIAPAPTVTLPNIKAGNDKFCIDLPNGRTDFGTEAQIYTCNNTPAQQFAYDSSSKLIRHVPTNRCLGNKDWRKDNGTPVDLVDCQGVNSRIQWERTGNSYKNIDSGRCLDVPNADFRDGAPLTIYDCNNTPAQTFN
jgi:hypothetical protein